MKVQNTALSLLLKTAIPIIALTFILGYILIKYSINIEIYTQQYYFAIFIFLLFSVLITIFLMIIINREKNRYDKSFIYQEHHFQKLIESTDNWVWEIDSNGIYTYSSSQVYNLLGYTNKEIIGKSPFDLMKETEVLKVKDILEHLIKNKANIVDLENINNHKNGNEVVLLTNGSPFFDEDGNLSGYRGMDKDITLAKQNQKKIEELAYFDVLTHLSNRSMCLKRIDEEIEYSQRNSTLSALLFIDLDGFKYINDSLGHHQGDEVLVIVAQRIQKEIRNFDIAGRIGGDEFIVLMRGAKISTDTLQQQIDTLVKRIIESINQPITIQNITHHLGASIGISIIPKDGHSSAEIIKHADSAMYHAKKNGKNRAIYYQDKLQKQADSILELKNELIDAFNKNELELFYQKQYDISGTKVLGHEGLIRWNHPTKGRIPPDKFIPYTEQLGLTPRLDKFVVEKACLDSVLYRQNNHKEFIVSVNINAKSLKNENFISFLEGTLKKYNVDFKNFTLEITEDSLIESFNQQSPVLKHLCDKGFKIALDDFGTGYSSLSYLSNFKFDVIKIDKKFVQGANSNNIDKLICKLIINLAKGLNVKIVAEGVETNQQLDFMSSEGVECIQGYLYAHPEPLHSIT